HDPPRPRRRHAPRAARSVRLRVPRRRPRELRDVSGAGRAEARAGRAARRGQRGLARGRAGRLSRPREVPPRSLLGHGARRQGRGDLLEDHLTLAGRRPDQRDATSTRVSLKQAPPEMSAWWPGTNAETVWPLSLVRNQTPLSVDTTPGRTASVIRSGRWISPRSVHTVTAAPSARPRVRASSGCMSSDGVRALEARPPNVDVIRRSEAGEINSSGYGVSYGRYAGSRAPYFCSR